jgi:hypothetical protein
MTDDKMPPLPGSLERTMILWRDSMALDENHEEQAADAVDAEVHTYARAYAAEQVRELVEALEKLMVGNEWETLSGCAAWHRKQIPYDAALSNARALIAKHKGTP